MKTFNSRTRELAFKLCFGYCFVQNCHRKAQECHHALSNTLANQKKYPLFLQSIFNCRVVCKNCHEQYSLFPELHITEQQAKIYEKWLEEFKNG